MFKAYRWLRDASSTIMLISCALLSLFAVTIASSAVAPNAIAQETQNINENKPAENLIDVSGGSITWGILKSWREYVGTDHITTSGGVEVLPSGEFSWPITSGTFDPKTNSLRLHTSGEVRFRKYEQEDASTLLDSTFKDVSIVISPEKQSIELSYSGNKRSDGEREEASGTYASLNIADTSPQQVDGITTWDRIPAVQSDLVSLYKIGTPIDPVTINYQGPGGKPDTSRPELAAGIPLLRPGTSWASGATSDQPFAVYSDADKNALMVAEMDNISSQNPAVMLRRLDSELNEVAAVPLPIEHQSSARFAYDGENKVFYFTDFSIGEDRTEIHNVTLKKAQFRPESQSFEIATVAEIPDNPDRRRIGSMVWDSYQQEVVLAFDTATNSPRRVDFVFVSAVDGSISEEQMELRGRNLGETSDFTISPSMFGFEEVPDQNLIPMPDGTYIAAFGGTYITANNNSRKGMPAFLLERFGKKVWPKAIDNTVPVNQAPTGTSYSLAMPLTSNKILLSTGELFYGDLQVVTEEDEEAEAGPAFTLPDWQNTAVFGAVEDSERDFQYLLGRDKALSVLRNEKLIHQYRFPDTAHQNFTPLAPFPLSLLADGSVVFQGVEPGTNKPSLRKFELAGVTPSFQTHPADVSVNLGRESNGTASLSATATATGLETSRVWQIQRAGEDSFTDISGHEGDEVDLSVTVADNGARIRAVERTEQGDIASQPATISVSGAPQVNEHPSPAKVEAGQKASFRAEFANAPAIETVIWQLQHKGVWLDINADDDVIISTEQNVSTLDFLSATPEIDGLRIRAKAINTSGDNYTNAATLTVGAQHEFDAVGEGANETTPPAAGTDLQNEKQPDDGVGAESDNENSTKIPWWTILFGSTTAIGSIIAAIATVLNLVLHAYPQLIQVFPPLPWIK